MKIKYLNLNIWMGTLWHETFPFLKGQNADIAVLQEVMHAEGESLPQIHRTKQILQTELGLNYSVYMPLALDKRHKPSALFGNLTLSRFPILESRKIFFDRPFGEWDGSSPNEDFPRGLLYSQIRIPGNKTLNVFNIHGIWGTHGRDTDRRLNMIKTVLKNINGMDNVILSGDFNLNENIYPLVGTKYDLRKPQRTRSVAMLEDKLINVFKDERITSFNSNYKDFINTGYVSAVVDMVFVSKNIKVLSHLQPKVDVSDHMPQVVELEIC